MVVSHVTALAPHVDVIGIKDRNTQNPSNQSNETLRWIVVVVDAAAATTKVVAVGAVVVVIGDVMVTALMVVVVIVLVCVFPHRTLFAAVVVVVVSAKNRTKYGPFCAHDGAQSRKTEKQNTTTAAMAMTTMAVVANRLLL